MKKNRMITMALASVMASTSFAQNPIIRNQYSADPTARVFNNRLYLFPSHDIHYSVDSAARKEWFCMADYHMFSSTDLTEWTDHGVILSQEQVPWGNPKAYSMWAPDCIQGKDGKYYFYFPDAPKEGRGFGVGVAIADNLYNGKFIPQDTNIKGLAGIDPCVLQASNGMNVMFWGAGGIVQAKMKDNLLELDGEPERLTYLPQAGLQEGPFAFERNGKYYLTYPWVRYKKGDKNEKGEVQDNPTEALVYCMSDNPMGPWEYKGVIMKEHENHCWTNHHSIVEFKGQWYLFYHHNDYSPKFDKNRSVCVDSLFFNSDGTIQEVKPTLRGVGITDARKPVQIDRYSSIGGGASIDYIDTLNYFKGWKTIFPKSGSWVKYNRIDTHSASAENVCIKVKSKGVAKLLLKVGTYTTPIEVQDTRGEWKEINIKVKTMPEGINDLTLTSQTNTIVEVDWITLSESPRETYFLPATAAVMMPDNDGFIRRWWLREPLDKPNRSNTVFVDSYLNENLIIPVKNPSGEDWHAVESNRYNVKLFRFATGLEKQEYGVIFQAVTYIDCDEEIANVRLAAGSNGASKWWLNDEEILLLSGDRRMVRDDATSMRITLKKGRNILRGTVINGPGMSDFCVRFIDEQGAPVKNFKINLKVGSIN